MLPIQRKISNYNFSSRNGNSIKYIVLHYTGNKGDTAKNNVDYFYNGDRSSSAHYFVDDTSIWQSVEEYNSAWAIGGGTSYGATNRNSISIEMCCGSNGQVTAETENNALELTRHLMSKYNVPISNVIRHYDCNSIRKVCPNWSSNNWSRWNEFKNKLNGGTTNSSNTSSCVSLSEAKKYVGNRTTELQTKLKQVGYNLAVDGDFGQNTYNCLVDFQFRNGLKVDALAGDSTFDKLDEVIKSKEQPVQEKPKLSVIYQSHVQNVGWQKEVKNDEISGTIGEGKQLEAFIVRFSDDSLTDKIKIQAHVNNIGDDIEVKGAHVVGTVGMGRGIEAIKIDSPIPLDISVHVENIGWMPPVRENVWAGTTGKGLSIQAIKIRIR